MARLYDKEKRQTDQLCRPGPTQSKIFLDFKKSIKLKEDLCEKKKFIERKCKQIIIAAVIFAVKLFNSAEPGLVSWLLGG